MKTVFLTSAFLIICSIISAQTKFKADAIIGEWYTAEDRSVVEIYKKDNKYYAKIIWVNEKERGKLDTNNPNEKLRSRPVEGIVFMKGFIFDEKAQSWKSGKVYDPESGNVYSGTMKLIDKDNMDLRGFVGVTLLGRTEAWKRKK